MQYIYNARKIRLINYSDVQKTSCKSVWNYYNDMMAFGYSLSIKHCIKAHQWEILTKIIFKKFVCCYVCMSLYIKLLERIVDV